VKYHTCEQSYKLGFVTSYLCAKHVRKVQGQLVARMNVARPNVARVNVAFYNISPNVARPNVDPYECRPL
jgi:hypothetical protein